LTLLFFVATFGAIFAAIQCFLVTLTGRNYRIFAFTAGFIGALLSILIEKRYRRQELAIYVLNQALETWYLMLMYRGIHSDNSFILSLTYLYQCQ
jgi:hypothetical protein